MRRRGTTGAFAPGARVYAEMVSRGREAVSQRRRWEDGRRALRGRFFGPVLAARKLPVARKALLLTDLAFPPLTTLVAALLGAALVRPAAPLASALAPYARPLVPVHLAMAAATFGYAASPFLALGLPLRYAASLTALPYYVAWKVVCASRSGATAWVRTRRESDAGRGPD